MPDICRFLWIFLLLTKFDALSTFFFKHPAIFGYRRYFYKNAHNQEKHSAHFVLWLPYLFWCLPSRKLFIHYLQFKCLYLAHGHRSCAHWIRGSNLHPPVSQKYELFPNKAGFYGCWIRAIPQRSSSRKYLYIVNVGTL